MILTHVHWNPDPADRCYRCGLVKTDRVPFEHTGWWTERGPFPRPTLAPTTASVFGLCDMTEAIAEAWQAHSAEKRAAGRPLTRPRKNRKNRGTSVGAT